MAKFGGVSALLLSCFMATAFAFPNWTAEIEQMWKKKWLGYFLVGASFALFVWFTWHLPPSGYGVVAMAVVAGIMAIRPEMGGWERSLWFVVLVCFAIIEIRAINHDREQAAGEFTEIVSGLKTSVDQGKTAIVGLETTIKEGREHFDTTMQRSGAIMNGVGRSINTMTGGDSYLWFEPSVIVMGDNALPEYRNSVIVQAYPEVIGHYAIPIVHVEVFGPRGWVTGGTVPAKEYQNFRPGELLRSREGVSVKFFPAPSETSATVRIFINLPTVSCDEVIELEKINGTWEFAGRLYRGGAKKPLREKVSKGFPLGLLK